MNTTKIRSFFLSEEVRTIFGQFLKTEQNLLLFSLPVMSYMRMAKGSARMLLKPAYILAVILLYLIPAVWAFWKRQYRIREEQLLQQEKVENPSLTAWKESVRVKEVPWYLIYVLLTAVVYYRTAPVYPEAALFLLLAPIQYLGGRYLKNAVEYRDFSKEEMDLFYKKMKDSEDVSFLWPDYSEYAILIRDDTNRIPVTFNRGLKRPQKYLFFDYEKEIRTNPKFQANDCMYPVYLHAKLFAYVLEASRYENLRKEIEQALTFVRYQIAKPVYIYILLDKEAQETAEKEIRELIRAYEWMPFVKIEVTKDPKYIDLDKIYEDSMTGVFRGNLKGYQPFSLQDQSVSDWNEFFQGCNLYPSYIYREIPKSEEWYYYQANNYYLCGFFHHMFRSNERRQAILAGFDYVDMVLRFVLFHFAVKRGKGFCPELVEDDIQSMGDLLLDLLESEDSVYETAILGSVPVNDTLRNALMILEEYFPIKMEGETMNFAGLVTLLRVLRNNTRGHGAIQDTIVDPLWYALYVLFAILGDMLKIYNFEIRLMEDGTIKTGYERDGELLSMREYGTISQGMPCPIYQVKGKKKEYINYFCGDFIIPHVLEGPVIG